MEDGKVESKRRRELELNEVFITHTVSYIIFLKSSCLNHQFFNFSLIIYNILQPLALAPIFLELSLLSSWDHDM